MNLMYEMCSLLCHSPPSFVILCYILSQRAAGLEAQHRINVQHHSSPWHIFLWGARLQSETVCSWVILHRLLTHLMHRVYHWQDRLNTATQPIVFHGDPFKLAGQYAWQRVMAIILSLLRLMCVCVWATEITIYPLPPLERNRGSYSAHSLWCKIPQVSTGAAQQGCCTTLSPQNLWKHQKGLLIHVQGHTRSFLYEWMWKKRFHSLKEVK